MRLDAWIARRLGVARLTRPALEAWQTRALRETVVRARSASPFYAERLGAVAIGNLSDLEKLPFMDARSLADDPLSLLCVAQDEVARVATFFSSGTTREPKRLFFTEDDVELTRDFFAHGMAHVPGRRVLVCMAGERPASVGRLLVEGLSRMGREGLVNGFSVDPEATLRRALEVRPDCLVGVPAQMLALARHPGASALAPLQGVLLSGDYAPDPLVKALETVWGGVVVRHYGMAETGYGAAVECERCDGLHVREADLLFEVLDERLEAVEDGEWGELAVTTLTRRGMPLIRCRTGDRGCFVRGACSCGSVLRRLETTGRLDDALTLSGRALPLYELEGALYALPFLQDFDVALDSASCPAVLTVTLRSAAFARGEGEGSIRAAGAALRALPVLHDALAAGALRLAFVATPRPSRELSGKKRLVRRGGGTEP